MKYCYITLVFVLMIGCVSESKKNITVKSLNNKSDKISINKENIKLHNVNYINAETIFIPEDILKKEKINLNELILDMEFIPLETTDRSVFGKIHKLLFVSNFYFIHDKINNKLLRFSHKGRFLNSIGTLGKGPKELLSIWDVAIDGENKFISILDAKSRKILKYSFSGEYLSSQSLFYAVTQHEFINSTMIFNVSKAQRNMHIPFIDYYSLIWADINSVPFALSFKNPENSNTYKTNIPLRRFNDDIYYYHPYSNGIWKVENDKLLPFIKFEFNKNGFSNEFWKESINNTELKKELETHTYFSGNYVIGERTCFFKIYGNNTSSNIFFNRKSKSIIYGYKWDYIKEMPSTLFFDTPITYKKNGSFIAIKEALHFEQLKSGILKNTKLRSAFKKSNLEKIMKLKETDNPVIIIYKLKDF